MTSSPSCLPSGVLSSIGKIFKEEGLLGFFVYVSLVLYRPHVAPLTGVLSSPQSGPQAQQLLPSCVALHSMVETRAIQPFWVTA